MVVGYFMLLLSGPQPRVGRLDICQSFRATWCAPSAFEANLAFLGNFGLRFSLTCNGTAQQWQGQKPFRFFCLGRTSASRNFPLAGTQMRTVRASFIWFVRAYQYGILPIPIVKIAVTLAGKRLSPTINTTYVMNKSEKEWQRVDVPSQATLP